MGPPSRGVDWEFTEVGESHVATARLPASVQCMDALVWLRDSQDEQARGLLNQQSVGGNE